MNTTMNTEKIEGIKQLYRSNSTAKALFDRLALRKNGATETKAKRAAQLTGEPYYDIIAVFKDLTELGIGRFFTGRKGGESRMQWAYDVRLLSSVAKGDVTRLVDVPDDADEDDDEVVTHEAGTASNVSHTFQLRPDFRVNIELPHDFTQREAERLSGWLKSLPFE